MGLYAPLGRPARCGRAAEGSRRVRAGYEAKAGGAGNSLLNPTKLTDFGGQETPTPMGPAMETGVPGNVWSLAEIVALLD